MTKRRVAVLISGAGTNLRSLCEAAAAAEFPAEVVLVLSNRRDAAGLGLAEQFAVPHVVVPLGEFGGDGAARDRAMVAKLRAFDAELVVCAGYNRVLSDDFLNAFPDAILNVHPSLLPAFGGGMHAVEDALAAGVRVSGCTVQFLEPGETDGGAIILQAAVDVIAGDTVETLRQRIHEQEWRLLPEAVQLWSEGRLLRDAHRVHIAQRSEVVRS